MHLEPTLDPRQSIKPVSPSDHSTLDVTGSYLDSTLTSPGASIAPADTPRIPSYIITGELAKGGMGRVLAGREERLDREVAIKVLLPGANAARFVTEAKITARLPHPSIPPVYALGSLTDGSPFLAMKLVRGRTLADELKARPQSLHELPRFLQIFEQIAQAVGFAHSQGIIHRDLKPANVMVGAFGEVQVMDWGLAKDISATASVDPILPPSTEAVAPPPTKIDETVPYETPNQHGDQTRSGAILGTPNYMAPEQARGEVATPQSDVFALGGILCSILTGKAVFGGTTVVETIQQAAAGDTGEALRRLETCEAETDIIALVKQCLSVNPTERPCDGQAVAQMVAAYRQSVEARLKKAETAKAEALVREAEQRTRRTQLLVAGAVVLLTLLAGLGISLWQRNRAVDAEGQAKFNEQKVRDERDAKDVALKAEQTARMEAERNLAFAKKGNAILGSVFAGLDRKKIVESGRPLQDLLRENLVKAVKELDGSAIGDPLEVAAMQDTLGLSLLALGESGLAIEVFQKVRDTRKAKLGSEHPDTFDCMINLATAYLTDGKLDLALPLYEKTLKLCKAKLGPDHPHTLTSMGNLAQAFQDAGKWDLALPLFEESLNLLKAKLGPDHPDTLTSMGNLAVAYLEVGKRDLALPLSEETLKLRKTKLGPDHPNTLDSMNYLGTAYLAAGKLDRALPLYEETLKLRKATLGPDHPSTLNSMGNLANAYKKVGKLDLAMPLYEETLKLRKAKLGPDHPNTLVSMINLASAYMDIGKLDLALPLFEETIKLYRATLGPDHPNTLTSMNGLAEGYRTTGKLDKALPLFEETLKLRKAKLGPDHPNTLTSMSNLANAYHDAGKLDLSLSLHEETLKLRKAKLGPEHPDTLNSMNNLATEYRDAGKWDLALPLIKETLKLRKAKLDPEHPQTLRSMNDLALAYLDAGRWGLALPLFNETLKLRKAKLGPDHPDTLSSMSHLAKSYREAGKLDLALPLFEETLRLRKAKLGLEHLSTLTSMNDLAKSYREAEKLDLSLPLFEETLRLRKAKLGLEHPSTLVTMNDLASAYTAARKLDLALPLLEETLRLRKAKLGIEHPDTLTSMNDLASAYQAAGKFDLALPLFEETLKLRKAKLGLEHPETLISMNNLATAFWFMKQLDKSIPLFEETLKLSVAKRGRNHPGTLKIVGNLGVNYMDAGRVKEAIPLFEEAYQASKKYPALRFAGTELIDAYRKVGEIAKLTDVLQEQLGDARKTLPKDSPQLASLLAQIGMSFLEQKRWAEAEPQLRECLNIREKKQPDVWYMFNTKSMLGVALLGQKKYAEAEPLLLKGYEGMKAREKTIPSQGKVCLPEALDRLIQLYTETNKPDEVKKWQTEKTKYPAPRTKSVEKK